MKICVLRSDAAETPLTSLLPAAEQVVLHKATIYRQLKALGKRGYDIFVNLCWGLRGDETPSYYEVVKALEDLNLPHTGTGAILYDTPKNDMKHIAYFAGVDTASFTVVETVADIERAKDELSFPMFVKPLVGMDGMGVDGRSQVHTVAALSPKVAELIEEFDRVLVEEYVEGKEYAVLVIADPHNDCLPAVYPPVNSDSFQPCDDPVLYLQLQDAARRIFLEMNQGGYACVDLKVNAEGEIIFLEVNAPCAVFGSSQPTPVDRILQLQPDGASKFLQAIIAEGIDRHQRRQKKYRVGKSPIATYGIFAAQALAPGDVIISGEAHPQRIVSRSYVQSHWADSQHSPLLRYVHPLGDVLVLRGANPGDWVLQNHSCAPNTAYRGLDLVAVRAIAANEELTVDFAAFAGEEMEGFDCMCGAPQCRGAFEFDRCLSRSVLEALCR
jgi:hypothetical protein